MLAPQDGVEGVACVWLRTIFCLQGTIHIPLKRRSASHLAPEVVATFSTPFSYSKTRAGYVVGGGIEGLIGTGG